MFNTVFINPDKNIYKIKLLKKNLKKSFNIRSGKFNVNINALTLLVLLLFDLEPLMQRSANLKMEKVTFPLIHVNVFASSSPFSMDINSASWLWYVKHSRPIPPVVVNTSGVKDASSTSRTRLLYILFFSFSWRRYTCSGVRSLHESAFGWHALTVPLKSKLTVPRDSILDLR